MNKVALQDLNSSEYRKNFTNENKCSNCGECCSRYLPMSSKETKKIIRYCEKHTIKLPLFKLPLNINNSIIAVCPFRDDLNKVCLIYPVRPTICKNFLCNDFATAEKTKNILSRKFPSIDMFDIIEICMEQD